MCTTLYMPIIITLNATPSLTHIYNTMLNMKKNSDFFYYTCTMINVINIFLTQQFQRKKMWCSGRIFPPTERSRIQSFSQLFLLTNKMDEKNTYKILKLVALKKQPPRVKED
jgi:hypothetical protein